MTQRVKKVVIDRSKWTDGFLLSSDGCSCVLGHILLACGIPREVLLGHTLTFSHWLEAEAAKVPKTILDRGRWREPKLTDRAYELVTINDEGGTWEEREEKLRLKAPELGVELEFVGEKKVGNNRYV